MEVKELIIESFQTLALNKMRTGLAVLGIVIGIGSVIALISLGQATQYSITSRIESLGSNLLTINPGSQSQGGVRSAQGSRTTLTLEDAQSIQTSPDISSVETVSPELSRRVQVITSSANTNTQVIGVTEKYQSVHKIELSEGVFISEANNVSVARVAVLGPQVATDLFGEGVSPLGQNIRINGKTFTVIGTTVSKGGTGFNNQDDLVYIPLSTAQKLVFGSSYLTSIALEAKSSEAMTAAQNEVGYLLLSRHKITDPALADFSIFSQQDILNTVSSTTSTFTSLLSGVAAISLLVGGIGIMNIMLVTVTERTREIGLRKALGAKKKTIVAQFLVESIILTFTGGFLGIILGIIISLIITKLMSATFIISGTSLMLAFAVSATIGIIFGWYPAKKASDLQPIEALRYE